MKTNFIITILLLFSNILPAQHQNLDKLPQKERDSILVKVANEAIDRFSTGYLRPGNNVLKNMQIDIFTQYTI